MSVIKPVGNFVPSFSFEQYRKVFEDAAEHLRGRMDLLPYEPVVCVVVRHSSPMIAKMGELKGKPIQKASVFKLTSVVYDRHAAFSPQFIHHTTRNYQWLKSADWASYQPSWHSLDFLNRIERRSNSLFPIPMEVRGYLITADKQHLESDLVERAQNWLRDFYRFVQAIDFSYLNGPVIYGKAVNQ